MKKSHKHEDASLPQQAELDIAAMMAKMQQQLVILENKIDSLISKSSERPFRGFDRFRGHENRGQGDDYRERRLFKVICAECNKECEVPFKPTGDRPVYCKDCFSRRKQGGSFREEHNKRPVMERELVQIYPSDKKRSRKNRGNGGKRPVFHRKKK